MEKCTYTKWKDARDTHGITNPVLLLGPEIDSPLLDNMITEKLSGNFMLPHVIAGILDKIYRHLLQWWFDSGHLSQEKDNIILESSQHLKRGWESETDVLRRVKVDPELTNLRENISSISNFQMRLIQINLNHYEAWQDLFSRTFPRTSGCHI